jgi:hypothetical protein
VLAFFWCLAAASRQPRSLLTQPHLPQNTHKKINRDGAGSKIDADLVSAFLAKLGRDCSKESLARHQQQQQPVVPPKWAARSWEE